MSDIFQFFVYWITWGFYAFSLVSVIGSFRVLRTQFRGQTIEQDRPQMLTLIEFGEQRLQLQKALAPFFLITAFCWPITLPLAFCRVFAIYYRNSAGGESEPSFEAVMQEIFTKQRQSQLLLGLLISPLFAALLILLYLHTELLRQPLTVWLFSIWTGWIVWLTVLSIGGNGIEKIVKSYPKHALTNTIIVLFLFAICIPCVTGFVILALEGKTVYFNELKDSVVKIYSVRGIVWTGARNTLAAIRSNPVEAIYVTTGALLYAVIIIKIPKIISRITVDDLQVATVVALGQGRTDDARHHLQTAGIESPNAAYLWIVALLMDGEIDRAHQMAKTKFPELREYFVNIDVAAASVLTLTCYCWELNDAVIEKVFGNYCKRRPLEADVFSNFLACAAHKNQTSVSKISQDSLLALSRQLRYETTLFVFALMDKELETVERFLKVQLPKTCSACPGVYAWAIACNWQIKFIAKATDQEELQNELAHLELCLKSIRLGGDILIWAFALNTIKSTLGAADGTIQSKIEQLENEFYGMLTTRPYGAWIVRYLIQLPKLEIDEPSTPPQQSQPHENSQREDVPIVRSRPAQECGNPTQKSDRRNLPQALREIQKLDCHKIVERACRIVECVEVYFENLDEHDRRTVLGIKDQILDSNRIRSNQAKIKLLSIISTIITKTERRRNQAAKEMNFDASVRLAKTKKSLNILKHAFAAALVKNKVLAFRHVAGAYQLAITFLPKNEIDQILQSS